eukprot:scaffold25526_cov47-Cyclotella_meneghiniana.AAC.3
MPSLFSWLPWAGKYIEKSRTALASLPALLCLEAFEGRLVGWLVAGAGVTGAGVGVETSALSATSPFSKANKFVETVKKALA